MDVKRNSAIDHALNGLNGHSNGVHASEVAGVRGRSGLKERLGQMPSERLQEMIDDPEMQDAFIRALRYGIDRNDRTCLNLYAQAAKLVGAQVSVAMQIVNLIGAPADRARTAVEAMDRVEVMPKDARARKMAAWLTEYCIEAGLPAPVFPNALLSAEVR